MTHLTDNELKALALCVAPNKDPEYMKDDRGCWLAGAPEMRKALGWTEHQVAGLLSSLEQKGMGFGEYTCPDELETHVFYPSDAGIDAAYAYINSQKQVSA